MFLFEKTPTGYNLAAGRAMVRVVEHDLHNTADLTLFTNDGQGSKQWATTTHSQQAAYAQAKKLVNRNR
jgi:hypothetical protein